MEHTDWLWTDCPGRLMTDPVLADCLARTPRALLRRELEGFELAFPWSPMEPFPIPPLFCLCKLRRMGGRWYAVFRFSRRGRPEELEGPA